MAFAIKAGISDLRPKTFALSAQKTMYGGKHIAEGDTVFVFASENEGRGCFRARRCQFAEAVARERGVIRQTPRVSVTVRRAALAKRPLGRIELKHFTEWKTASPGPSSISSSIVRRRTRSSAFRMKRRGLPREFFQDACS